MGYTSWYRRYDDIDADKLAHDLEGAKLAFSRLEADPALATGHAHEAGHAPVAEHAHEAGHAHEADPVLAGAEEGRAARVFQIDDGWARIGDWLSPDPARFPHGMAPLAAAIREAGFVPGIWLAPFCCEKASQLAANHPDWLLRDTSGEPVATGSHWSGGLALDTRKPAVRDHVTRVLQTVTRDWGFSLLKLDFLYAACMIPHDGRNRGELMADGLDLARAAVGDDVAILACGVPLGSAMGRVEYARVGCDVAPDWDGSLTRRHLHRERPSTARCLAGTVGRAPLDGRAFLNDPDVVFLSEATSDKDVPRELRKRLLLTNATLASCLLTSDDMGDWDDAQVHEFARAVAEMLRVRRASDEPLP